MYNFPLRYFIIDEELDDRTALPPRANGKKIARVHISGKFIHPTKLDHLTSAPLLLVILSSSSFAPQLQTCLVLTPASWPWKPPGSLLTLQTSFLSLQNTQIQSNSHLTLVTLTLSLYLLSTFGSVSLMWVDFLLCIFCWIFDKISGGCGANVEIFTSEI